MANTDFKAANKIRFNKHLKRKNNDVVAAMYAMYCLPKSLEEVGEVYRKSRQAVYDVFRTRGYPLRSKPKRGEQILDGISFYETKKRSCLRGTTKDGHRIMMHHYVWTKAYGEILPGFCIWHKDRNPSNNVLENLEAIPKISMSKFFNPKGNNQYTKYETTQASA